MNITGSKITIEQMGEIQSVTIEKESGLGDMQPTGYKNTGGMVYGEVLKLPPTAHDVRSTILTYLDSAVIAKDLELIETLSKAHQRLQY